jgi:hypothetical protein
MSKRAEVRIDPATAPTLFEKYRVCPIARTWADPNRDNCGCLVAILAIDRTRIYTPEDVLAILRKWDKKDIRNGEACERLARSTGLHEDYILGLIHGWDNRQIFHCRGHSDEYVTLTTAGWDAGHAAAVLCGIDVPFEWNDTVSLDVDRYPPSGTGGPDVPVPG